MTEPRAIAIFLTAFGVLIVLGVLTARASRRLGVPFALLFLATGVLAGEEAVGGIRFDDYHLAFRFGTVALVLILFDGGLNTPFSAIEMMWKPAALLATAGVIGTAALVAVAGRLLGLGWPEALLVGAVVSSTDAAAVFSVLRGSGLQVRKKLAYALELESGLNDPMAVILTLAFTELVRDPPRGLGADLLLDIPWQLGVGLVLGVAIGHGARLLLRRVPLVAGGLYPVITLAVATIAYGVPTLAGGSGFLAVYACAVVLGNRALPYRPGLLRVHDALAWASQVTMFLMLGLLVTPSRLAEVALLGLGIGAALTVLARPLSVLVCLLPFHFPIREIAYVGWVGLRGAVPVILATFPVLAGAHEGLRIFDLVFFVVVVSSLIPGATLRWMTRAFGFQEHAPPAPQAVLEITSTRLLRGDVLSFYIDPRSAVCGAAIAELPFPPGAGAMLILRGDELIAPKGRTVLAAGDHVFVFCRPEDQPFIHLLFGQPERS
jgi:cell volume regulation protein A